MEKHDEYLMPGWLPINPAMEKKKKVKKEKHVEAVYRHKFYQYNMEELYLHWLEKLVRPGGASKKEDIKTILFSVVLAVLI